MWSMTWTLEFLAAIRGTSISGRRVARELTTLIERRGKSGMIVSDHGTEFPPEMERVSNLIKHTFSDVFAQSGADALIP